MAGRLRDRLLLAAAVLVLVLCLLAGGFWLGGGRWLTVRTPSMAETAPVGTLLITQPVHGGTLRVGEFIVFTPPTAPAERYAHRIVAISPDGSIRTKGDLNAAVDPWTLHRSDVVGRVVARLWGLGWLLRALPILLLGLLVILLACRYWVRRRLRLPAELLLGSALVAVTLFWLRPFVRADLLSTQSGDRSAYASLVGTGLLPIQAHAAGAGSISLRPGQRGMLMTDHAPAGTLRVEIGPHLSPLLWLVLVCCWLLPLALLVVIGVRPRELKTSRHSLTA